MSKEERQQLDQALSTWVERDDIVVCDACDRFCMRDLVCTHYGSMRKEMLVCPECDLPDCWSVSYSKSRKRRFYIYFDPSVPSTRILRWSHPNPENKLHDPRDRGEIQNLVKKKRRE